MMHFFPRSFAAAALALALVASGDVLAQGAMSGVPNAMQGFSQNRDQPIQIEAAARSKCATRKGGDLRRQCEGRAGRHHHDSKSLVVFYDSGPAPAAPAPAAPKGSKSAPMQSATPGPGGSSSIRRLEAKGSVVVTQKDQVVTGETAIFDTRANLITMVGGVVLTQCKNVLRGDRLKVDMTTGVSRVESDSGKVQGMFLQGENCGRDRAGPSRRRLRYRYRR
jgi:lipopolysaccharide export system protein LptA